MGLKFTFSACIVAASFLPLPLAMSVVIPVHSFEKLDGSQLERSSTLLSNSMDYWPDFFPAYDEIDQTLTFLEGVKSGFISAWSTNSTSTSRDYKFGPVYKPPGLEPPMTSSKLLKKHGMVEVEEDASEETEIKYEVVKDEEDDEDEESQEVKEEEDDDEENSQEDDDKYGKEDPPETKDDDEDSEETEVATTTEQPQFSLNDIQVPFSFLRIEYMIGYAFLGLMYGLGFLVLFQSICVPIAKFFVFISYLWAIYFGIVEPITKTDALQYIPPNK